MIKANEGVADYDDDWGCEHCRNDGRLNDLGICPKCDAQYTDETGDRPAHPQPMKGNDNG